MSALARPILDPTPGGPPGDGASSFQAATPDAVGRRLLRSGRFLIGGGVMAAVVLACLLSLPWTVREKSALHFDNQRANLSRVAPTFVIPTRPEVVAGDTAAPVVYPDAPGRFAPAWLWLGTDMLGRSLLGRCLLGGAISLLIGVAAAGLSVVLGVGVGLIAGYRGGWLDAILMRTVDVLYGLPYVLLIVLLKIALEPALGRLHVKPAAANLVVLFLAIGLVSWLTMARVVRGQVLSLRAQPFIEACRAGGLTEWRIFTRHLLPNLIGPISVYATLTIPQAILQESFLSFLGIGIQQPMPTWGALASEGLMPALNPIRHYWYMLVIPCALLSVTLLSLNFLGDGLRDVFDPKREAAKI